MAFALKWHYSSPLKLRLLNLWVNFRKPPKSPDDQQNMMVSSLLLGIRQHDTETIIFALPDSSSGNFWIVILTQHSNIFVLERISNEAKEGPGPIYGSQIPFLTTWKMCIQFHHPPAWDKLGETTKKYQYNKGFTCKWCQSNNYPFMRIQGNFIWSGASTTRYSMQL